MILFLGKYQLLRMNCGSPYMDMDCQWFRTPNRTSFDRHDRVGIRVLTTGTFWIGSCLFVSPCSRVRVHGLHSSHLLLDRRIVPWLGGPCVSYSIRNLWSLGCNIQNKKSFWKSWKVREDVVVKNWIIERLFYMPVVLFGKWYDEWCNNAKWCIEKTKTQEDKTQCFYTPMCFLHPRTHRTCVVGCVSIWHNNVMWLKIACCVDLFFSSTSRSTIRCIIRESDEMDHGGTLPVPPVVM